MGVPQRLQHHSPRRLPFPQRFLLPVAAPSAALGASESAASSHGSSSIRGPRSSGSTATATAAASHRMRRRGEQARSHLPSTEEGAEEALGMVASSRRRTRGPAAPAAAAAALQVRGVEGGKGPWCVGLSTAPRRLVCSLRQCL